MDQAKPDENARPAVERREKARQTRECPSQTQPDQGNGQSAGGRSNEERTRRVSVCAPGQQATDSEERAEDRSERGLLPEGVLREQGRQSCGQPEKAGGEKRYGQRPQECDPLGCSNTGSPAD